MDKNKVFTNQAKNPKANPKNEKIKNPKEKSTRFQENYYNPKLHKKNWEPSGKVKEKNKYTYGDSGLGYNLNSNGQNKDINIKEKSTLDKTQTHFLEFDFIENNDIIITIEHCSNCEQHLSHTNHINDIYKTIAKLLQLCINIRYPFIKVFLKPIDTSDNKHTNRLGALEIQLAMKINEKLKIMTLFSKLNTNQWPNFNKILNKINNIVPLINIKCTIYDKEEDEENSVLENNNNKEKEISKNDTDAMLALPSKYENIKINLYSLKNEQIEIYCQEASNQLDIAFNPKRKTEIYYEEQNSKNNNNINNNINNNKSNMNNSNINKLNLTQKTISTRPQSGYKNKSINNTFNYSLKNNSTFSFLNQSKRNDIIEDMSILNKLKGKLLSEGYSDKNGNLFFENVPYDSYLIEVENSKNFMSSGAIVQFQKILSNKKNISENGNYLVNKLIGLKRQIDAYVEVYLFSKGKEKDFSGVNLISGARVILVKKFFDSGDIVSGNVDEFDLEENKKIKGRYEIITVPGEAELNVFKQGYENVYKQINLRNGMNKINIELIG